MAKQHFEIAGARDFKLDDDICEAWAEMNSVDAAASIDWQPLFNPKDWEANDVSKDPSDYRLSTKEIEQLAE